MVAHIMNTVDCFAAFPHDQPFVCFGSDTDPPEHEYLDLLPTSMAFAQANGPTEGDGTLLDSDERSDRACLRIDEQWNVHFEGPNLTPEWMLFWQSICRVVDEKATAMKQGRVPDLAPLNTRPTQAAPVYQRAKKRSTVHDVAHAHNPTKISTDRRSNSALKRRLSDAEEPGSIEASQFGINDRESQEPEAADGEKKEDPDPGVDPNARQEIDVGKPDDLYKWYWKVLKHVQQQHCRSIGQDWIKAVHPKKQGEFPYSSIKVGKDGKEAPSKSPGWWPRDVEHKEPAHLKFGPRMALLLHIICNLERLEVSTREPHGLSGIKCPSLDDLKKATAEDDKLQKSPKAKYWLAAIYRVKEISMSFKEGGRTTSVISVPWPKMKPKGRRGNKAPRMKIEAHQELETHQYSHAHDAQIRDDASFSEELYEGSDSDLDVSPEPEKDSPSTPTSLADDISAKVEPVTSQSLYVATHPSSQAQSIMSIPGDMQNPQGTTSMVAAQGPPMPMWHAPPQTSQIHFDQGLAAQSVSQPPGSGGFLTAGHERFSASVQQAERHDLWGSRNSHHSGGGSQDRAGVSSLHGQHQLQTAMMIHQTYAPPGLSNPPVLPGPTGPMYSHFASVEFGPKPGEDHRFAHPGSIPPNQPPGHQWPEPTTSWPQTHQQAIYSQPQDGVPVHVPGPAPPMSHSYPQQRLSPVTHKFEDMGMDDQGAQGSAPGSYPMHQEPPGGHHGYRPY